MEKELKKELIKKFRLMVSKGKLSNRPTFLAYAWLRGVPYRKLEKVINEDKFGIGLFGFLRGLACTVASKIVKTQFANDGSELLLAEHIYIEQIYTWMLEKYPKETTVEESAA